MLAFKEKGIKFVEAKFLDWNGNLRSRTFPIDRYLEVVRKIGFGFDGSSVGFAEVENSDMVALPYEETLTIIPGTNTAFVLCDVFKDGKPFEGFGKRILSNLLQKIPYNVLLGPEIEFYLTKNKKPIDEAGYMHSSPFDEGENFKKEFIELLKQSNLEFRINVAHHEVGPSQHEIELKYDNAIAIINKLITCKYFLQKFAETKGFEVTYMPKPFFRKAGSGMHFHISLWENGKSLFFKNENDISDLAKNFIAGILEHAREIALATNSTINSYKRLVKGFEAPVYCVWGFGNRSALIRIPKYRSLEPINTRIEVRCLDGLNDHFLACASIIKAGMIGIEKGIEIQPFQGNAYEIEEMKMLPRNLGEAIGEAKKGKILKELLGKNFDKFIKIKEREWKEYCDYLKEKGKNIETNEITEWEIRRYFLM